MNSPCLADYVDLVPCRDCGAAIAFAVTARDKRIPMDPIARVGGNVACRLVEGVLRAHVFGKLDACEAGAAGAVLFVSHFASCPNRQRPKL